MVGYVVVGCNNSACPLQSLKPVLIEVFIPECAVKTLGIPVLGRAARLDPDVLGAPGFCAHVMKVWPIEPARCRF